MHIRPVYREQYGDRIRTCNIGGGICHKSCHQNLSGNITLVGSMELTSSDAKLRFPLHLLSRRTRGRSTNEERPPFLLLFVVGNFAVVAPLLRVTGEQNRQLFWEKYAL